MKKRSMILTVVGTAAVCMAGGWALQPEKSTAKPKDAAHGAQPAGQPGQMDPKMMEMMQKMTEAGTPGDMHKMLTDLAGEWTFVNTFRMDPSMPEMTSTGTATYKSLLGGRFIECTIKGDMMGEAFEGRATMGYNNSTKKFESTWIDSMSTQTMFGTGTWDAAKKQLTTVMEGTDCMTGKPMKMTEVTTHNDKDHITSEFTMPDMSGKDFKGMTIKYTRKGASEGHAPAKPEAKPAPRR